MTIRETAAFVVAGLFTAAWMACSLVGKVARAAWRYLRSAAA